VKPYGASQSVYRTLRGKRPFGRLPLATLRGAMTQDQRYHEMVQALNRANLSTGLAAKLARSARIPTKRESADIDFECRRILANLQKLLGALPIQLDPSEGE
jgi:hypothetical protein